MFVCSRCRDSKHKSEPAVPFTAAPSSTAGCPEKSARSPFRGSACERRRGWTGEIARERVGRIPALQLAFGPGQRSTALVEEGDANHAHVAVVPFACRVGILHGPEAERRDRRLAAP